jgi:hypothetical protein
MAPRHQRPNAKEEKDHTGALTKNSSLTGVQSPSPV